MLLIDLNSAESNLLKVTFRLQEFASTFTSNTTTNIFLKAACHPSILLFKITRITVVFCDGMPGKLSSSFCS